MNLKDHFTFLVKLFYAISLSGHGKAVASQYPSYYSEFENSINTDVNPYYPIKIDQHKDYHLAKRNVNMAALVVGGTALIGAMGVCGVATLEGLKSFKGQRSNMQTNVCCNRLEDLLEHLKDDVKEVEDHQDKLKIKVNSLCNQARKLGPNNFDTATRTSMPDIDELSDAHNELVDKYNNIVAHLNQIPGACNQ